MSDAPSTDSGFLLCETQGLRVAFLASDVEGILQLDETQEVSSLRQLLRLPNGPGRMLISASGAALGVDTVEIHTDRGDFMEPPNFLCRSGRFCPRGFIQFPDALWPLFRLDDLVREIDAWRVSTTSSTSNVSSPA